MIQFIWNSRKCKLIYRDKADGVSRREQEGVITKGHKETGKGDSRYVHYLDW